MKESDIRNRETFLKYLELSRLDAEKYFKDNQSLYRICCPACGSHDTVFALEKHTFTYDVCPSCETLFVNPRPSIEKLTDFYKSSESTRFWVNEFFLPMVESRRQHIFKPRAEFFIQSFGEILDNASLAEIGAGFGLFLEELRKMKPECRLTAIEPSKEMAEICRQKGFNVIEKMFENASLENQKYDFLVSFELVEHLQNPKMFFELAKACLNPGGKLVFTTLSGMGMDIQVLWEKSNSLSPPHHLNFFNPHSIELLLRNTGFKSVEVTTPGKLDWDIIETTIIDKPIAGSRFWQTIAKHASSEAKKALQEWVAISGFSSHMRVVAS